MPVLSAYWPECNVRAVMAILRRAGFRKLVTFLHMQLIPVQSDQIDKREKRLNANKQKIYSLRERELRTKITGQYIMANKKLSINK